MAVQVYENIYQVEIPLPQNPLRAVNCYIIKSEERNLVIDTGFNMPECRSALLSALADLDIDIKRTDLFVTHLHSDHSGLASALNQAGMRVYTSPIDGRMINEMSGIAYWEAFDALKVSFGLEADNLSFDDHPGYKYCPKEPISFIELAENDKLQIRDYTFQVVDLPGHTPGLIGLYEPKHRLFFCGDHVLEKITPNIAFWGFEWGDILEVYFRSLDKIYAYDIDYLFAAHRSIIRDHRRRINELRAHHAQRLDEVRSILRHGSCTVRDTAVAMHWELRYDCWEQFPNPQKWFAAGEAMSHLEHLLHIGEAERTEQKGVLFYSLKKE